MTEVDTGKPPMSWNQYQAGLAAGEVEPIGPPEHVEPPPLREPELLVDAELGTGREDPDDAAAGRRCR